MRVVIRPGMLVSESMLFKGMGNQQPKQAPSDLIVKFKQSEDNGNYRRQNFNDLVYTHKTTLLDVIQCKPVSVVTLDGRTLTIPIDQVMSPC